MKEENESLFRQWVQAVWNEGNVDFIDDYYDEDGVAVYQYSKGNEPIQGRRRFKSFVRLIRRHFVDIDVTIDQLAADEKKIVAVCTFKGACPPTPEQPEERIFKVSGLCQLLLENGKIVHLWNNIDLTKAIEECRN